MNNSTISLNRLISLLKLTLQINFKRILYTTCIGLGVWVVFLFSIWSFGDVRREMYFNKHEYLFVLSLYITGFIFSGSSFIRLCSKQGTIDYLMIPASNAEKFITEFLLTTFMYHLFFLLTYWIFSVVANSIMNSVFQAYFMPFSFNVAPHGLSLMVYVFIQSIFLFGAASFQKIPLIKTLVWALLVVAVIILLFYITASSIDYSKGTDELAMNRLFYGSLVYYWQYLVIPVGLVFWLLAFLKLKEKEA
ncbi:MAG: hypothetical protein ACJASP_001669 [Roseivirga sp.]|jgi:hypothetical protein